MSASSLLGCHGLHTAPCFGDTNVLVYEVFDDDSPRKPATLQAPILRLLWFPFFRVAAHAAWTSAVFNQGVA